LSIFIIECICNGVKFLALVQSFSKERAFDLVEWTSDKDLTEFKAAIIGTAHSEDEKVFAEWSQSI
jgi:hypothetical protein